MTLINAAHRQQLIRNSHASAAAALRDRSIDHYPVVKLFTPVSNAAWLLSEIDPEEPDRVFGLCDLGCPEVGCLSLSELSGVRRLRAQGQMGANHNCSSYTRTNGVSFTWAEI
jgi:DUF2958 family protein